MSATKKYRFPEVLREGMFLKQRKNRPSTSKTEVYNSKPLLRFFHPYVLTFDVRDVRRPQKPLTPEAVMQYIDWRREDGVKDQTIRRELALASRCITICKQKKFWFDIPNPFENPDLEPDVPRTRVATGEEISAILLAADQPLKDMVLLWLQTWMRVSELRELKRSEDRGDRIVLEHQKNGTDMPLAVNAAAREILDRQPEGTHFFQWKGAPMSKSCLVWLWKKARRKAGVSCPSVSDLTMRDLRRTGATMALSQPGVYIGDISAQLRHKSIRMAERVYTTPSVERAKSAVDSLAGLYTENVR